MSIILAPTTSVHFKITSLNLMEWCASLFSVVYILCVFSVCVHHQRSAVLHLGFLSWGGTLISWWIQGSFALPDVIWVHQDFFPLGAKLHPHPPGPPAPPPVLEHGDFTLLLCKACFSVWVWQTHGFLRGEVTEDTQQRRILFLSLCYENIQLSHIMTNYKVSVDCKLAKVTLPQISLILVCCPRWIQIN